MEGTVVDQAAKEGETLNAVQSAPTIVTVADLKVMTVEAQVSEADIGRLKPGMPVYFTLLGQSEKRFTGTLRQIKPTPATENNVVRLLQFPLHAALRPVDAEVQAALPASGFRWSRFSRCARVRRRGE